MIQPDDALSRQAQNDAVRALLAALDLHAPGERAHAERVAVYATATAYRMGWLEKDLLHIRWAASLHDVGKIAVSPALLAKKGGLTQTEIEDLKLHSQLAIRVIESFDWLAPVIPMIKHHHERWDGGGYPSGLDGENIPQGARIIAVAEAFDVMTIPCAFREPIPEDAALEELRSCAGTQFDRDVVEAFAQIQPLVQPVATEPV